ncbi:hypothetical protein ACFO25_03570 [Paenactinomyces guangxiensis]|uniref:Uncharacterized protein n=1 Tax=Paenactinomyces guangxiensis TaxID=1490290 RepID=A0A7W1WRP1_9BACL|nr:hypothetical protein [Paenactinomyces guangxiensis]MBA4494844.1 hypothetical protein [Paenactinomyces guangxiensis]MBH8591927.1 hypothetical protein [Paenactinomyces guangxiensis]
MITNRPDIITHLIGPGIPEMHFPAIVGKIVVDNISRTHAPGKDVVTFDSLTPWVPDVSAAVFVVLPNFVLFDTGLILEVLVITPGTGWTEPNLLVVEVNIRTIAFFFKLCHT